MNNKLLSICIPTYNRSKYLIELLESLIPQISPETEEKIEVIISDNCSEDGTCEKLKKYLNDYPFIKYYKNEKNIGFDGNILKLVDLANGKYIQLMGDDDQYTDGAIEDILKELESDADLYLFNRQEYDMDSNYIGQKYWFNETFENRVIDLTEKSELINLFKNSYTLGCVFSYISSIFIKKSKLSPTEDFTKFIGTGYVHVYLVSEMISKGASFQYINKHPIRCLCGNFDYWDNSHTVNRILMDFESFCDIAERYFSYDKELMDSYLEILKQEHNKIDKAIFLKKDKESWSKLIKYAKKCDYSAKEIKKLENADKFFYLYLLQSIIKYPKKIMTTITQLKQGFWGLR